MSSFQPARPNPNSPLSPKPTSSDSTASVKVSSPLNPASPEFPPKPNYRPRGQSISTVRDKSTESSHRRASSVALSTVQASSSVPFTASLAIPDSESSTFRVRSRSKSNAGDSNDNLFLSTFKSNAPKTPPTSWWNEFESQPKDETTEGWEATRTRVAQAAHSVLGTAACVTHQALFLSVELLEFAPVPGLQTAARTLLEIWDAVIQVDSNRLACLRITERCADILLSVRQEVSDAGDQVGTELQLPIARLTESFQHVSVFLQRQVHRPFIKRYLKRDEILKQITGCDKELGNAMELFSVSIQIRILKSVQASDRRRQADTDRILESIIQSRNGSVISVPPSVAPAGTHNALQLTGIPVSDDDVYHEDIYRQQEEQQYRDLHDPLYQDGANLTPTQSHSLSLPGPVPLSSSTSTMMPSVPDPQSLLPKIVSTPPIPSPRHVIPTIAKIRDAQNDLDATGDYVQQRLLMKKALMTKSDLEVLQILGVKREEIPEAIKTLQRALEGMNDRESGTESSSVDSSSGVLVKLVRRMSLKGTTKEPSPSIPIPRLQTPKDTLDREFIEAAIDALRRMSLGTEVLNLPSWTITRYEVDREHRIGYGAVSDVYKGTWRGRTVAIKVLAEMVPQHLFVREVEIWKQLRHNHVLELFGASSTVGDPPWFFVSPYEKNGSLVEFLRRLAEGGTRTRTPSDIKARTGTMGADGGLLLDGLGLGLTFPSRPRSGSVTPVIGEGKEWDLLRYIHEIAKGMDYLHSKGVLHGDLKAANILINDRYHCVISDFGQSEIKSEAYRISGTSPPKGTLRWQAPELMSGTNHLTTEMDVYAFGITCVEVLGLGKMPWSIQDDEVVRQLVLKDCSRPTIPPTKFTTPALQDLLKQAWHQDPHMRPTFSYLVKELKTMRKNSGSIEMVESPKISNVEDLPPRPSPDMRPIPLSGSKVADNTFAPSSPQRLDGTSFSRTGRDMSVSPPMASVLGNNAPAPHREDTVSTTQLTFPEPVIYTPSRASSLFTEPTDTDSSHSQYPDPEYAGYDSPPPIDDRIAEVRNERRYRLLLTHEFHPSLTLPLWTPSPVKLGAVGYLAKPSGSFVTLFNAFAPHKTQDPSLTPAQKTTLKNMPSIYGYGDKITTGIQKIDRRNVAQRGLDAIAGLLTFKGRSGIVDQNIARRYSYPLRAGHKTAFLCTESTAYRYVDNLDAPKAWFKANVAKILEVFGGVKEDLFVVIGTLDTPDHALFVGHTHPDGQAHFNVYSSPRNGQPWGLFTTDTHFPAEVAGPAEWRDMNGVASDNASKVSLSSSGTSNTVLIARLRFKPDVEEPTSL